MRQIVTVPKQHEIATKTWQNPALTNLEELVRRRVLTLYEQESKTGERWTAEKLMKFLGMTVPSGVRKLLNGTNRIGLAHVQGFCEAFGVTPSELVAPHGASFTHLKDSEPTLLRLYREMDAHERLSLLTILQWRQPPLHPKSRLKARLGRMELTAEQQLVVDLYARSEPQAREGVLKVLRGTAQKAAKDARPVRGDTSE
jgi:transcriptional regulator with XRE-family HTH domain